MLANILSIVTFLPLLGAAVLLALPNTEGNRNLFRWGALCVSVLTFLLSLLLLVGFKAGEGLHHVINVAWIPQLNATFFLGVDGISLWLVLLNTFLFPLAIISSIGVIKKREKMYYAVMLMLETAITGTFLAQDLLLFFFFWEAVLIPMYFIIGIWGGKQRMYAATKFIIYTLLGSLLMLAAIIALYLQSGVATAAGEPTFSMEQLVHLKLNPQFQFWCFLAFFLAFAIKVPLFPFHTWLPDAHTEAPTAGSIILAGVLLKMGTYGFIRFAIPLFPDAAFQQLNLGAIAFTLRDLIMALAVVGIIYGALVAAAVAPATPATQAVLVTPAVAAAARQGPGRGPARGRLRSPWLISARRARRRNPRPRASSAANKIQVRPRTKSRATSAAMAAPRVPLMKAAVSAPAI
ncbi:MAG: NADH-quinone oxidoreductase subunit M [Proteobacteria bacterium]|nr:NADH-quinone oxidoreductase subunit M [Pseudomonadota bacterium]